MGEVFQSQRKASWAETRRGTWHRPRAPVWLPLVVLAGVAADLHIIAQMRSGAFGRTAEIHSASSPNKAGSTVVFRLCGSSYWQNCVIDGDTIQYAGARIRIADIDAPETHDPKCASEAALGARATQRLLDLMNAGPFEVVSAGSRDRDKYGRDLRLIRRDGRSVGGMLVAEGLARRWDGARHPWCS